MENNPKKGCDGGDTPTAYGYAEDAGGIEREKDMPYYAGDTGFAGQCKAKKSKFVVKVFFFSALVFRLPQYSLQQQLI